jgi:hypothetical protein
MNFNDIESIKELDQDYMYDLLCRGISDEDLQERFKKLCKITITEYHHLFDIESFTTKRYATENNPEGYNALEYVLPTLKRAFSKFYIKTPEIFENWLFTNKLELFQLQFDLDEFLKFFSAKFDKNWNCLNDFEHLDPVSEVLTLIVHDYVAQKVNLVQSTPQNEITSRIRDKKIEKINK